MSHDDPLEAARKEMDATGVEPAREGPGEQPGDVIGRYKLLERIGEGGMGTVWMADQREPVKRRVALKIIKLGMDTREVVVRFEAERQALALMDHPNIAHVLDGGATDTGRPYFVMELVRGTPITDFCDLSKLGLRERLELFVKVCEAIQHAHHKGVIHRDVKPSNVLVTLHDGRPVPKVIDFGIAKATSAELTQKTLFTQFSQMIGTPEYMAPEQAEMSGLDIDTRADVYSLGVLLYELLTGTKPFDAQAALAKGYQELLRSIREDDPIRPSTRVSTLGEAALPIAKNRHASLPALSKRLRGDLDWIVMKALEKDRTRRYETANGFAADIGRYLREEDVLAAPPSAAYKLRKLVHRRRGTILASGLVLTLLVAGGTASGIGWWKADRANRDLAVAVSEKTDALERETRERERAEANEARAVESERQARESEERAVASEREAHESAQRAQAAEAAERERAEELQHLAEFQGSLLKDIDLAGIGRKLRYTLAMQLEGEERQQLVDLLDRTNLTAASRALVEQSMLERADALLRERFADQPGVRVRLLMSLARTYDALGSTDALLERSAEAEALAREAFGTESEEWLRAVVARVDLLVWEQSDEAKDLWYEAKEVVDTHYDSDHELTRDLMELGPYISIQSGHLAGTAELLETLLPLVVERHGPGAWQVGRAHVQRWWVYRMMSSWGGGDDPRTREVLGDQEIPPLAELLELQESSLRSALEVLTACEESEARNLWSIASRALIDLLQKQDRLEDVLDLRDQHITWLLDNIGVQDSRVYVQLLYRDLAAQTMTDQVARAERLRLSEQWLRNVIAVAPEDGGYGDEATFLLAQNLYFQGRADEAVPIVDRALAGTEKIFPDSPDITVPLLHRLAQGVADFGDFEVAARIGEHALRIADWVPGTVDPELKDLLVMQGRLYWFLDRRDESLTVLTSGFLSLRDDPGFLTEDSINVLFNLIEFTGLHGAGIDPRVLAVMDEFDLDSAALYRTVLAAHTLNTVSDPHHPLVEWAARTMIEQCDRIEARGASPDTFPKDEEVTYRSLIGSPETLAAHGQTEAAVRTLLLPLRVEFGPGTPASERCERNLTGISARLLELQAFEAYLEVVERLLVVVAERRGEDSDTWGYVLHQKGVALTHLQRLDEVLELATAYLDARDWEPGDPLGGARTVMVNMKAMVLVGLGRFAEGLALYESVLPALEQAWGTDSEEYASALELVEIARQAVEKDAVKDAEGDPQEAPAGAEDPASGGD